MGDLRAAPLLITALVASGCAAGGAVPAPPPHAEEEWDRELPGWIQLDAFVEVGDEAGEAPRSPRARVPVRVVEDATGEPVAGARIDNWWEADTPHAEPWEDLLEGSFTTDPDGWVLLPSRDDAPWYYVEAPGFAPLGEMGRFEEHRLQRGRDYVVEVRDWRDRPVPGASLDLILGCGHTPSARVGTAGPDGRVAFRCVDGDDDSMLWVRAPGVAGRSDAYGSWGDLPAEGGVLVLRGEPSPTLEGRVLRADGSPAAGARVGTRSSHRGPWTVAGPDGRFRLDGAEPFDHLVAMAPITDPVPEGIRPPQVEFPAVPGVFATVRLPAEGRPWPTEEERKAEREEADRVREAVQRGVDPGPPVPEGVPSIRVRVEAAPGAFPFGPVRVLLVRDGDGAAKVASLFPWPAADRRIAVDPGTWTVTAGSRAGRFRAASRRVVVGEGEVEAVFTLEPNPAWRPRFLEGAGGGAERESEGRIRGKYFITTEEGRVEGEPRLDGEGFPDGFLHVPAEGPFAVEFEAEDGRGARVFLEGPPEGEGPSFLLGPPIPWEEEEEPTARPRRFPPALLRVLLPDGTPAAWADGCARYPAPPDPRFPGFVRAEEGWFRLDETGATEISFDGGERVEVEAEGGRGEGLLPLAARIEGPGPWTLRWPAGEVRVRAVDEAGDPLAEFSVSLGGWETLDAVEGSVLLRGVGAGPLRFWVAAEGRRMRDLRIVLAEGERREVVLRMSRTGEGR